MQPERTNQPSSILGGGFGYTETKETLDATIAGTAASAAADLQDLNVSIALGMKIHHFFWEAKIRTAYDSEIQKDFGGLIMTAGFYF